MKEDFCGACVAIPLALAGAGTTAFGASKKGSEDKKKKWLLISGISLIAISVAILGYYYFSSKKNCKSCKAN